MGFFFQKGFCLYKEKTTKAFKGKLTVRQQKLEMPNRRKIFNGNLMCLAGPLNSVTQELHKPRSLYLAYHPLTEVTGENQVGL